jgi:VanZ family protein
MALILWLASDAGSAERTGRFLIPVLRGLFPAASPSQIDALHALARKTAHAVEYAVLAALWLRAWLEGAALPRRRAAAWAGAIAAAWAVVDETFQATVGSRTGSALDVTIDVAGALAVAVPGACGWRLTVDRVTRALLWLAVLGGLALLGIDLATGVASGVLWLTVPVAAVALALWRRRTRAAAAPRPRGGDPACRAARRRRG